jgi:hypothetical protein
MEQIVYELRKQPSVKYPIPSTALRVTQSFCSPTTFGTAFCITGSTELPNRMQSFTTSATSAFEPVIRTPPRPPKSEKIREKQMLQIQPEIIASTSTNPELPPRPIPPPRRSLQKNSPRPIPPPRQRIAMTASYHSQSNFIPFESISSSKNSTNNTLSNALSTPNLMNNSICCSSFEPYSALNYPSKTEDLMTSSWYGPLTSTKLQPIKHIPHRIRIPVKPHQLSITVVGAKNSGQITTLPKLIKPIPIRSPDSAFKVMRSQSSVTPSRLSSFHSPGTTSGAGTASGTSLSNPSVTEFQTQNTINKHILSSPTASKDSGAHDCSIFESEIEIDECAIKHVDKDFEERIKRWDSCSGAHKINFPQEQATIRPTIPPPIAPKPILSNKNHDLKIINKFFDRCGLTSITSDSVTEPKVNDTEDVQSQGISSVDSNFTSITDIKVQLETNDDEIEKQQKSKDCNESDAEEQQQKTNKNVASKPVSMIEKNARVIQWIHGCTLASTVC